MNAKESRAENNGKKVRNKEIKNGSKIAKKSNK